METKPALELHGQLRLLCTRCEAMLDLVTAADAGKTVTCTHCGRRATVRVGLEPIATTEAPSPPKDPSYQLARDFLHLPWHRKVAVARKVGALDDGDLPVSTSDHGLERLIFQRVRERILFDRFREEVAREKAIQGERSRA